MIIPYVLLVLEQQEPINYYTTTLKIIIYLDEKIVIIARIDLFIKPIGMISQHAAVNCLNTDQDV